AIIFADLLLPFEVMGMRFHFASGEGPVIEAPLRHAEDIGRLRTDGAGGLAYVAEAVQRVARHFGVKLPVIGFCGAPFTLASYMIEGGGSRNYLETKKLMYREPDAWDELMRRIVRVLSPFVAAQVDAGADAIQVFDSWVGCLSPADYSRFVLPHARTLISDLKATGAPVIYFGTGTATLLPQMKQTRAEVIGVDWRVPMQDALAELGKNFAVQGNLDPALLFAPQTELRRQVRAVLDAAGGRSGYIFNLGHGILPETPVENVLALVEEVHSYRARKRPAAPSAAF